MDWNKEYINQYLQGKIIKYPHEQFFKDNNTDYTHLYFDIINDLITIRHLNVDNFIVNNININPYISLAAIKICVYNQQKFLQYLLKVMKKYPNISIIHIIDSIYAIIEYKRYTYLFFNYTHKVVENYNFYIIKQIINRIINIPVYSDNYFYRIFLLLYNINIDQNNIYFMMLKKNIILQYFKSNITFHVTGFSKSEAVHIFNDLLHIYQMCNIQEQKQFLTHSLHIHCLIENCNKYLSLSQKLNIITNKSIDEINPYILLTRLH